MIEIPLQLSGFAKFNSEDVQHADVPDPEKVTAGVLLREARESAGLQIAALASALKVPVKKLEALESDRHDLLLDMVFVRALAASVCRTLKVDSAPVLELLPYAGHSAFKSAPVIAPASFNAYQPVTKATSRAFISAPAALGGLLLFIGAAVLIFLPLVRQTLLFSNLAGQTQEVFSQLVDKLGMFRSGPDSAADATVEIPVLGVNEVAGPRGFTSESITATTSTEGAALTSLAQPIASRANSVTSGSALSPPLLFGAPLVALKSTSDIATGTRLVAFSATAQSSWVKVTDARGAVVLSRTIAPGEQAFAAGELPLAVVVGRADAMRVMVRGVAFDLDGHSKENVARFEVK